MLEKARGGRIDLNGADTTKDFVYIDDVARAFCSAIDTPFVGAINIGTGLQTSLGSVVSYLHPYFLGLQCSLQGQADKATRMQADISRAKRVLDWRPTVSIWEGLRAVIGDKAKIAA